MSDKDLARVLDEISDEQISPEINLLPGVLAKVRAEKLVTRKPSLRPVALLLLVGALLVALFSLPGVASALRKMAGYIPGIGMVDQSAPLRVLAGPVTAERGGYTLTVESAVLDATRTVINYSITGRFPTWADPTLQPEMCRQPPLLRLADGRELTYPSQEGSSYAGEVHWQAVFPAVPAQVGSARLVFPCLQDLPAGEGPQDWEFSLAFVPAPPEMTVYPVVEPPTATPPAVPLLPANTEESSFVNGLRLDLQGTAALNEGYYLQALLSWQMDPTIQEVQLFPNAVHLSDAAGQEIAFSLSGETPSFVPAESGSLPLNVQTVPIKTPGPLKLVLDYVGISQAVDASFTLDVGDSPQPGQKWELNKDMEINGLRLRVLSAEYISPEAGPAGTGAPAWLMLYLSSDSGILAVSAMDAQHEILGAGGSPGSANVPFRAGWRYKDFPRGVIVVDITRLTIRRAGPWTLTWTPPIATLTAAVVQSQQKGLCLEAASLSATPVALPAGLSGRVVFSDSQYKITVSNLDGSDPVEVGDSESGRGVFPDLSRDGKRVVYRQPDDGIHISDVAGGNDLPISGPRQDGVSDVWPKWSPDGRQVAFVRVTGHTPDIYLVNADGSTLRPVLNGPEDEYLIDWSSDGSHLIYSVTVQEQLSIRSLDLPTGLSTEIARMPHPNQIRLSPDGKRIVYAREQEGVYLLALDGSAPVLLVSGPLNVMNPLWSPDGRWLALTYWQDSGGATASLALLNPDTCQFIPLGEQKAGWLWSWVP